MVNIYKKGARKEYAIVDKMRKRGFDIVFRSAGSHSCIDVVAINTSLKIIQLIQSKRTLDKDMSYVDPSLKHKLLLDNHHISGQYVVEFDVM